jgi:CubicO group peptidase (beta-lactamase class C family)
MGKGAKSVFNLILVFFFCATASNGIAGTVESDLDAIVSSTIQAYSSFPNAGIAVGVIKDGQVVFAKGYGLRDWTLSLPVTPQTRFAIGSNTKSFTALGLAMLKDKGQFEFDTQVNAYLPNSDFKLIDPGVSSVLTTADMCSHRSGLARHDKMMAPGHFSRSEIIRRMQYLEMDDRLNYGFHKYLNYNNLMFVAAGVVTETISKVSWEDYTRREILTPLGMDSTSFALDGRTGNPEASLSYNQDGSLSHVFDIHEVGPAGSMNSDVIDMLKYLNFYLSGGATASGARLISPANLLGLFQFRTLLAPGTNIFGSPNICFTGATDCVSYYGLGWALQYDGTNYIAYHGGEVEGFYSFMSILGAKNLGVVVLNNVDHNPAVQALGQAINRYFISGSTAGATTAVPPSQNAPASTTGDIRVGEAAAVPEAAPSASSFTKVSAFSHPAYGDVEFLTDGEKVIMKYFDDMYWQVNFTADPSWVTYSAVLSISPITISPTSTNMYLDRGGVAGGPVLAVYPFFDPYALSRFNRKPLP